MEKNSCEEIYLINKLINIYRNYIYRNFRCNSSNGEKFLWGVISIDINDITTIFNTIRSALPRPNFHQRLNLKSRNNSLKVKPCMRAKQRTLNTLTSVCIFSLLFSIHSPYSWLGEFVSQSRAYLVGDHFLHSHDLNVWLGDEIRH